MKSSSLVIGGALVLLLGFGGLRLAQALSLGLSGSVVVETAVVPTLVILAGLAGLVALISLRTRLAERRARSLAGGSVAVSMEFDHLSISALLRRGSDRPVAPTRLSQVVAGSRGVSIWTGNGHDRLLDARWADVEITSVGNELQVSHVLEGRSDLYSGRVHRDLMRLAGDAVDAGKAVEQLQRARGSADRQQSRDRPNTAR